MNGQDFADTDWLWEDLEGAPGYPADHPAARPGTGQRVEWHDEVHVVSPWFRCFVCGWYRDVIFGGRCACGARNWVNLEPERKCDKATVHHRALGASEVERLQVDEYQGSSLSTVLQGLGRGLTVLIAGAAGVGKSTIAAQASFVAAEALGKKLYWLDADQLKWELIEETFARAGCSPDRLRRAIVPVHRASAAGAPDPAAALAVVPKDGVLVLDSLEAWAPRGDKQALDVLRQLRGHPARVKLVVAATNARGSVAGAGEIERAGDATVFVERNQIRVGKCRWAVGTTWTRHGPSGLDVRRADEADENVSPPTEPSPSEARQLEADFSADAVRTAARWSIREIEAYRARLRAGGVPKETILGWDRAVDAERAAGAATREGAHAPPTPRASPFPDSAAPACAALAAAWPWREAVRAGTIAEALVAPGLEELGCALRALLGASEGVPLSATDVGNALRIARGASCPGAVLTRQLDRKGVALWHLVRRDEHSPEHD